MIAAVDEFILYDDMQYTRRDWRNRNLVKTPLGVQWVTVPVKVKGKYDQTIRETEIDGIAWLDLHWKTISHNYKRSKYYDDISQWLKPLYCGNQYTYLTALNRRFIEAVCSYLDITTKISNSWDYTLHDGKTERLVDLCIQSGGTEYISGPAAKDYIQEKFFQDSGIKLTWFDYEGYPQYPQLWGDFVHGVTILDLLFNCGPSSLQYLRRHKK